MRPRVRVEEEVGRGEAVGAVWALTGGIHDTTALCVRDSELVRMSKVSRTYLGELLSFQLISVILYAEDHYMHVL